MGRWREVVAGLAIGLGAGIVVLGIGGRIVMRVIAWDAGLPPSFSLGGSLEVLAAGAWRGLVGGLLFVALRRFGPANAYARGLLLGGLLFLFSVVILADSLRSLASELDAVPLALGLFGGLFALYAAAVELAARRWRIVQPTNDSRAEWEPPD